MLTNSYVMFHYSSGLCWITMFLSRYVSMCHVVVVMLVEICLNIVFPNGYATLYGGH